VKKYYVLAFMKKIYEGQDSTDLQYEFLLEIRRREDILNILYGYERGGSVLKQGPSTACRSVALLRWSPCALGARALAPS
jgi:hypothetical protein